MLVFSLVHVEYTKFYFKSKNLPNNVLSKKNCARIADVELHFSFVSVGGAGGVGVGGDQGEKQDKRVRNIIFTKYNSLGQYQIGYLRQKLTDC